MAPESSASPRMTPATPASRRRRTPSRSVTPPATSDLGVVAADERVEQRGVGRRGRRGSARAGGRRADELLDQRVERGGRAAAPRERGDPLRPRIEADRQPVARDREAPVQRVGPLDDATESTTRVAPAANASRRGRRPPARRRAGAAPRPPRDRADCLEVRRRDRAARRRSRRGGGAGRPGRRTAPRSARAGRSARPMPAAAPGQKTTRERPASTSIAGMTSIPSGALAAEQPPVEADRQRAVAQQRVVERQREVAPPSRRCSSSRSPRIRTLPSR